MTYQDDYTQARITLDAASIAMLATRLTYSTIQVRLREAALEEEEDQVADLEKRSEALAPLLDTRTRRAAALTAEAEQLRVLAVAEDLDATLTTLTAMMAAIGAQVRQLADDLAVAVTFAERAQQSANTLPEEKFRLRLAANEVATRMRAMRELTAILGRFMGEDFPRELPDERDGGV